VHNMSVVQIDTGKVTPHEKPDTETPMDRSHTDNYQF
jgi:hypothetical protein